MTDEERDEQFYRDTESVAFPKLDDHQLSLLEPIAQRRTVKRGDILFKAGQRDFGLIIVLRGEVEGVACEQTSTNATRDESPWNFRRWGRALRIGQAVRCCSRRRGIAIAGVHLRLAQTNNKNPK